MPTRTCQVCAQPYDVQYESNRKRTCSRRCSALLASRSRPQNQRQPAKHVDRTCPCGQPFTVLLAAASDRPRAYCSRKCGAAYRQGVTGRPPTGSGYVNHDGYRMVYLPPDDPMRPKPHTAYVAEHRLVMARMIGRQLLPGENVHHKNGNRLDNRPENLELWVTPPRPGQRVGDLLAHARYIIETYQHLE